MWRRRRNSATASYRKRKFQNALVPGKSEIYYRLFSPKIFGLRKKNRGQRTQANRSKYVSMYGEFSSPRLDIICIITIP